MRITHGFMFKIGGVKVIRQAGKNTFGGRVSAGLKI